MLLDPIPGSSRFILADDRVMDWIAARIFTIPQGYRWEQARAIGLVEGGKILAGMVVHNYVPSSRNCHISFAGDNPRWATRSSIRAFLRYPFEQLNCRRVTTGTPSRNERALRFNAGLGFVHEGVMRWGFGNDDCVIMGLLREESPEWMGFR